MPRFHFHFRQDGMLEEDTIGIEFPTVEAAYLSAFEAARDIWHDLLGKREDPTFCCFDVRNGDDQRLFELPFSEVLETCRRPPRREAQRPSRPIRQDLAATHLHAQYTRREIRYEFEKARAGLAESRRLLSQLGQLTPDEGAQGTPGPDGMTSHR